MKNKLNKSILYSVIILIIAFFFTSVIWGQNKGSIEADIYLVKKNFCPGEDIIFDVEVNNNTIQNQIFKVVIENSNENMNFWESSEYNLISSFTMTNHIIVNSKGWSQSNLFEDSLYKVKLIFKGNKDKLSNNKEDRTMAFDSFHITSNACDINHNSDNKYKILDKNNYDNIDISENYNYFENIIPQVNASIQLKDKNIDPGELLEFNLYIQNESEEGYQFEIIILQEKNGKTYFNDSFIVDNGKDYDKEYSIEMTNWPITNSSFGSNYQIYLFGKPINDKCKMKIFSKEIFSITDIYKIRHKNLIFGQILDVYGNPITGAVVYLYQNVKDENKICNESFNPFAKPADISLCQPIKDFDGNKCECFWNKDELSGMLGVFNNVYGKDLNISPKRISITGKNGFFSFHVNVNNNYKIIVQANNFETKIESNIIFLENNAKRIDFHLRTGELVKGKIVDNFGNPIAFSNIAVEIGKDIVRLKTNHEGIFKIYLFGKKFYDIYAAGPFLRYFNVREEVKPPIDFTLTLNSNFKDGNEISGYVTDAYTGKPIFGTELLFYSRGISGSIISEKYIRINGFYKIKTLSETGLLFVDAPGYSMKKSEVSFIDNNKMVLNFQLNKGATISGHVIDKVSREPIKNAKITILGSDLFEYEKKVVITDKKGDYIIEGTESFAKKIIAKADGYGYGYMPINVQPEAEYEINFELEKSGKVFGIITDQDGNPLPDVEMILMSKSNDINSKVLDDFAQQISTDNFGFFSFYDVTPGRNIIYAWPIYMGNYEMLIIDPFTLEPGEEKEVNGQLNTLRKINIIIRKQKDSSPVSNLQIHFLHPIPEGFYLPDSIRQETRDKIYLLQRTDSEGKVSFMGSATNYILSIGHLAYLPIYQEVLVSPSETEKLVEVYLEEQPYVQYFVQSLSGSYSINKSGSISGSYSIDNSGSINKTKSINSMNE